MSPHYPYYNSHNSPTNVILDHFKFVGGAAEYLKRRASSYKSKGLAWWTQSKILSEYITKNNNGVCVKCPENYCYNTLESVQHQWTWCSQARHDEETRAWSKKRIISNVLPLLLHLAASSFLILISYLFIIFYILYFINH